MQQPTQDRNLITLGALTVDADTGEILDRPTQFAIDSPDKLSWWLSKMRQLRALADSEKGLAERATSRSRTMNNAADHLEALYRDQADTMVRALLPKGRRSIRLDGGEAGIRTTPGAIVINDALTALEWCKIHYTIAVKIEESLLKTPIADLMRDTTTLPPGVEQTPATERLWVK